MDKSRFHQLFHLASDGDYEAAADLWLEFTFDFFHDSPPAFVNEPSLEGGAPC